MTHINTFEKKLLSILALTLLSILATGGYVNNIRFSDEINTVTKQAEHEALLVSSIIDDILQSHDYKLVENVLIHLAKNRPEILEITLTSDNNFEMVRIDRPLSSDKTITKNITLNLPDKKTANLKIIKNVEDLYTYQTQHTMKLLMGYLIVSAVLCFFSYLNIKTGRQKQRLQHEIELRKKTEKSYRDEKEKADKSAQIKEEYAAEIEHINIQLKNEIHEKRTIEDDLKKLNETLELKVNERTEKLELLNEKIGTVARKAGMAEVATGVLHNVGNVLNSINISASLIREQIKLSKTQKLSLVANMLEEHKEHFGEFIENNDKGKQIPSFLNMLAKEIDVERQKIFTELDEFADNITHIKSVIKMQQSYAGQFGVKEKTLIADLIEDALKINMSNMNGIQVDFIKEQTNIPEVYLDKHKILQILINLISNAKYALLESETEKRVLRISAHGENKNIIIQVQDNGVGIDSTDLSRIFEYGFKKRQGGHGFGLHNCALIANELNGKIEVHSAGLGKGTCFTLTISESI